ncbi:hypothetical protein ACQP1W_39175 [Spirillospora sp. CA-255316]
MALSGRTKIGILVAGAAGAAALGLGGAALADPGQTELRIVGGHEEAPGTGPGTTGASWNTGAPGKDCPERTATPDPAQAADGR